MRQFLNKISELPGKRFFYVFVIIVIIGIASGFRLTALSNIPNGFYCDEASTGYDAYSLLRTGRDQWGEYWPLFARTFGAYDEALYRYLVVPCIHFFGLNEFAVRLPAALTGILTVLVFYLLVKECFNRKTALVAAFFMAVSPWHVHFSRIGFRAILMPLFICAGLLFFIKGLRKRPYLYLSAATFATSLYTYSAARIFVPIFLLATAFIFRKDLIKAGYHIVIAGIMFLLMSVPGILYWISPHGMARADLLLNMAPKNLIFTYLSYFNPRFLFIEGDANLRHSIMGQGQLYFFEWLSVIAGILYALKDRGKICKLFLVWLFLYPIPAALTDYGHALRSITGVPVFCLLSALGVFALADTVKDKVRKPYLYAASVVTVVAVLLFRVNYFVGYPVYSTAQWQYGLREAFKTAKSIPHDHLIISDNIVMPHIFALFYTGFSPEKYHKLNPAPVSYEDQPYVDTPQGRVQVQRYTDYSFDKFHIQNVGKPHNLKGRCLYIMYVPEIKRATLVYKGLKIFKIIKNPAGRDKFAIAGTVL